MNVCLLSASLLFEVVVCWPDVELLMTNMSVGYDKIVDVACVVCKPSIDPLMVSMLVLVAI